MSKPLAPGFHPVAAGQIAAVVTHLEMTAPPANLPDPDWKDSRLAAMDRGDLDGYRSLFRAVGSDSLWFSRLRMTPAELAEILADPRVEPFALHRGNEAVGLLELDFRQGDAAELSFLGLVPGAIGQGLGQALMAEALRRAWARPILRLTVHTCTLDSPVALPFYQRWGFRPVRREVEILDDPRLTGEQPPTAGPRTPLIG